MKIVPVDG